jgi:hypothetical protein
MEACRPGPSAASSNRWIHALALKADWRDLAGVISLTGEQLGPYVEVHDELVAEQFVCPSSAASLWVEVLSSNAPPARDFALTMPTGHASDRLVRRAFLGSPVDSPR